MIEDEIEDAFKIELSNILKEIKFDEVPAEYTTFYNENILNDENLEKTNLITKFCISQNY